MTPFPPTALSLAGFTLAHAAWSLAEADADEFLCPLAVVEDRDGVRRVLRFEADTQEQAIIAGKAAMRESSADVAAWAFAREAAWYRMAIDATGDILAVDFWATGMPDVASLMQPFYRASRGGRFRIGGVPTIVVGDERLASDAAHPVIDAIVAGARAHAMVATLWSSWQ